MNVWGSSVRPPSLDRALAAWLLNAGVMGGAERRFFEETVTRGQVVVDVGANQGVFTLLFSRLVGREGRVLALEPEPRLFAALDENCRRNGADNVTRRQMAAGETQGRGRLQRGRFNRGDNRMTGAAKDSVPVDIVSLDGLLPSEAVSLVKIDVQGYELNVVKGMQGILDRAPAIKVFFEYWPAGLGYAGSPPGELLEFFLARRFSLFELSRNGVRKRDGRELARSIRSGGWSWTNLLAVRE